MKIYLLSAAILASLGLVGTPTAQAAILNNGNVLTIATDVPTY